VCHPHQGVVEGRGWDYYLDQPVKPLRGTRLMRGSCVRSGGAHY